ncbi:MAG TPA: lipocalin family protein [Acidisoma sp.]|uniref:lipocalin family protein n=1 Tax=Acidisoma sp. TaxID=1872115 RepID=UPI002CB0FD96|nr:lipocalin family protein [Acidisoma sp.]HTI01288.1 lipocalin family protein [Acidisoma sp.]
MARRTDEATGASSAAPATRPALTFARLSVTTLALLVAGLGVIGAVPRNNPRRGRPVPRKPVEIDRYLGLWYEFARYENRFERGCEAVTADYAWRPDGLIRIVNTCRQGGLMGRRRQAEARGRVVPGSGNAKLKVAFFGPFFWGNYWVLDHAEDYSWSIVGEGSRRYLWILTREAHPASERRALLLDRVQALGYGPEKLHMTRHPEV